MLSQFEIKLKNSKKRTLRMRRARKLGTHTKEEWESAKTEFLGHCARCWTDEYNLEKDHIIPIYRGGSDSIDNIQALCARCNASKGPEDFNWKEYRRSLINGLD